MCLTSGRKAAQKIISNSARKRLYLTGMGYSLFLCFILNSGIKKVPTSKEVETILDKSIDNWKSNYT